MRPLSLVLALTLAPAAACALPDSDYFGRVEARPDPTHFRWCNNGEPEYVDPALGTATVDIHIMYQMFDGLTQHDAQGLPEPSLATSWTVSEDQRTFTFSLRRDGRWSNGRAITSADFVYSLTRVLHPLTASARAESLWKIRNGEAYTSDRARLLLADAGPFRAGDVVEVLPDGAGKRPPSSNLRKARAQVPLTIDPQVGAPAHAKVPTGGEVTVIELDETGALVWVHAADGNAGDGVYGWAPRSAFDAPNDGLEYRVRGLPPTAPIEGTVRGRDLLMTPAVLGIRAPDPYTLVIHTGPPTPYLVDLTLQAGYRLSPREAVAKSPRRWTRPGTIVTSGPFHLRAWRERDKLELIRSPTFWDRAHVRLERVTILSVTDVAAAAAIYHQGGCDATVSNNLPASYYAVLAGERGGRVRKDYLRAPFLGVYVYLINVEKLSNRHLRRALSHALDRRVLPEILKGGQIPTEQYTPGAPIASLSDADLALCGVSRDSPGVAMIVVKDRVCYVPPLGPRFDLELAKKELALAKAELGAEFPSSITIRFNTGVEYHKHIAEWVQHQWHDVLGLDVRLESQEFKTFLKDTRERRYQVARLGWIGNLPDPEAEFLRTFRCKNPDNRTGFCDPEFERLFDLAENEPDRQKRMTIIAQAEAVLMDQAAVLPMFVYTQHHLQKPYVRGLDVNFVDQQNLRRVWIDPDWQASLGAKPR